MSWTVTDDPREHDLAMDDSLKSVLVFAISDLAWNRSVGEIEIPDILRGFYVQALSLGGHNCFELPRVVQEKLANFRPSADEMKAAIEANFPETRNVRQGVHFGKGAWETIEEARKIAQGGRITPCLLFLALLQRDDVLQVLQRAGYSEDEVHRLKDRAIDRGIAVSHDQNMLRLRRKRLFVVPALTGDDELTLRNSGIRCLMTAGSIAFDGYEDLMRACARLQMKLFSSTIIGGTKEYEVRHTVLKPEPAEEPLWRSVYREMGGILPEYEAHDGSTISFAGDGLSASADGRQAFLALLKEHLAPAVKRNITLHGESDIRELEALADDVSSFHVTLTFDHQRYRDCIYAHRAGLNSHGIELEYTLGTTSLTRQEIGAATKFDPEGLDVRAEVQHNAMFIRMSRALFQDDGSRMILLDQLLRKCGVQLSAQKTAFERFASGLPDDGLPEATGEAPTMYQFSHKNRIIVQSLVQHVFMRGLDGPVMVSNLSGGHDQPRNNETFAIFYNATPSNVSSRSERQQAGPSGAGVPILDQAGCAVAELFDRCLFIYADMVPNGNMSDAKKLANVLIAARRQLVLQGSNARSQLIAQQYADEVLRQFRTAAASGDLAAAEQLLNEKCRLAQEAEDRIARNEDVVDFDPSKEFDRLLEVEKVRDVRVTANELVVETDVICCVDPRSGKVHRIGEFNIHIPLEPTPEGVRFLNKAGTILAGGQDHHAPHVSKAGTPCLGNIKDLLPRMVERRELVPTVQLCIAFLESVNIDDVWGKNIDAWPVEGQESPVTPRAARSAGSPDPAHETEDRPYPELDTITWIDLEDQLPWWLRGRDRYGYEG